MSATEAMPEAVTYIESDTNDLGNADEPKKSEVVSSPHMNPDWLKHLKRNFQSIVVDQCSKKVKDAVNENQKLEKISDIREVRLALIHRTIDHIQEVHGGVNRPRLSQMREVANELVSTYPAMFKDEDSKGYGLGGSKGQEGLPLQMLDILRNREGRRNKKLLDDEGDNQEKKKGKRKYRYGSTIFQNALFYIKCEGVDNDKYYEDVSSAVSGVGAGKLAKATEALDFDEREEVFIENRKILMSQFRLIKGKRKTSYYIVFSISGLPRSPLEISAGVSSWIIATWIICSNT